MPYVTVRAGCQLGSLLFGLAVFTEPFLLPFHLGGERLPGSWRYSVARLFFIGGILCQGIYRGYGGRTGSGAERGQGGGGGGHGVALVEDELRMGQKRTAFLERQLAPSPPAGPSCWTHPLWGCFGSSWRPVIV